MTLQEFKDKLRENGCINFFTYEQIGSYTVLAFQIEKTMLHKTIIIQEYPNPDDGINVFMEIESNTFSGIVEKLLK